jgi:uncharacterized protein YndB with AHSA1/START domain
MADRVSIQVDSYYPHPPGRVWRAFTDPRLLAEWLMPNDLPADRPPAVGQAFTFTTVPVPDAGFDGVVHARVLAVEPERLLRLSWRGGSLDTTVTWRLEPEGHGTRVFLEHSGFDPDDPIQARALGAMGGGWRTAIPRALARVLTALDPARPDDAPGR